ncbi:6,7-dimethyl-8-ribityllumazine synthase [Woodsholea maritima]|uniref:6,7-dimethyl-8-ribityllumazine synthase n=1 Tax=Woodsholea maritima TaxID=240237 RepID=UPI0003A28D1E|nr:6,7-dimethyl-8-ribityllumazine synthase [Woodsholea maritima]
MTASKKVLIISAPFYEEISADLLAGAKDALDKAGVGYDVIEVPGALEIPGVIAICENAKAGYEGYVALGCVIRGETSHYDTVCNESARGIMDLTLEGVAIGNGIITVENILQARARARLNEKNKGGGAAVACLAMMAIKDKFES